MKRVARIVFISVVLSGLLFAQNNDKSEQIKTQLNSLFDLCKNNKYEQAAGMIAYTGKDEKRNLTDVYNYKDQKEASKVKRIVKKIKAFIDISDKFIVGAINIKTVEDRNDYTVEVLFISGNQELKTLFTFVKIGNKFLMADLN